MIAYSIEKNKTAIISNILITYLIKKAGSGLTKALALSSSRVQFSPHKCNSSNLYKFGIDVKFSSLLSKYNTEGFPGAKPSQYKRISLILVALNIFPTRDAGYLVKLVIFYL